MSGRMKIAIGGIIIGLILLFINPWIGLVVIAAAIAVPVGAYLMLDPSQRRRLRNIQQRRKEILAPAQQPGGAARPARATSPPGRVRAPAR